MRKPFWLIITAAVLLIGLIAGQLYGVVKAANQQEEQFNSQVEMAMNSIENRIGDNNEVCTSISGCLIDDNKSSCSKFLCKDDVWKYTDAIVSEELEKFNIDLNYDFDFCYKNSNNEIAKSETVHTVEMEEVFNKAGIVLYLDFPDKWDYLRNQMGGVFISSILIIFFLSVVFVLTYRYYRKERAFSLRTRDFINNMTHEFKTPLTNISLANRMMSKEFVNEMEHLQKYATIIDEENERLVKNCEDLLQMAKIENMTEAFRESIDTHEIIKAVVETFDFVYEEHRLRFDLNLDAANCRVLGKETYFFNTLKNLIDNAIKYSKEEVLIRISTKNLGGKLHLEVVDNGIGIEAEQLEHIFDKFYRVSEGDEHNVKGFGLGLSYVKTVITKMNGKIKVLSRPGKGSTFGISLPVASA
jgi:two-component system, OmpR family, phosphate regulon sensor histidine kinase PhoR